MVRNLLAITTLSPMYKYYNRNPLDKKLPDCVCRAISLATRTKYDLVMELLEDNGICYDCEELTVDCYSKMLNSIGFEEHCVDDGQTVDDICNEHPEDIVIIRIEGHLTCSVNGDCYDIWDCTNEKADKYWVVC